MARLALLWIICSALVAAGGCERSDRPAQVAICAAASLTEALRQVVDSYEPPNGAAIQLRFGSSGTLARQIEAGAPAEVFLSANERWMDYLQRRERLVEGTRRALWRNRLVVVTQAESPVTLTGPADLVRVRYLALGNTASVPAGLYARQALRNLGLWETLAPRIVAGGDVRMALAFVERGEAEAGVVYLTDARASARVRISFALPQSSYAPIVYPGALVRGGRSPQAARAFLDYLGSPASRAIFRRYGFEAATP